MVDYYAATLEMLLVKCFFTKEREMCLGCLHRCPKFAISYGNGKTDRHGQYKNPYTRI